MTEFESAVIISHVKADPGVLRRDLSYRIRESLNLGGYDESTVLSSMDQLEGLGMIARYKSYSGYHMTPSGTEYLQKLRSKLQPALNLINASY